MQEIVITVSQLGNYIKQIFDAEEMLYNISVKGEISGLKTIRGISYFDLKDEFCILPCICFESSKCLLIKNGDNIIVKGTPKFYVKGGKLSFIVNNVSFLGQGDLYQKFLETKNRLQKEGLFDESRKKPFPSSIKRIGVITSETGAVIEDIITISKRRNPFIDLVVYPVKVQGDGSDFEVSEGIEFFEDYNVDIIIIARGGGSFEDLNCFNSEVLARKVVSSNKFIISAIGHETDYTILDFVADLRAPTPSAAAELAVEDILVKKTNLINKAKKLILTGENILANKIYEINVKKIKLNKIIDLVLQNFKHALSLKSAKLDNLSPEKILKMGYVKINKNNKTIISKKQLNKDDKINICFLDGCVSAKVLE